MDKDDEFDGAKTLPMDEQAAWVSLGDLPTLTLDAKGVGFVDRYELLEKLGQGGFGAVYGASDTEAGILVALKALPAEVSCDESEMKSIRKNFALVSRLHHPHIASVLHLHRVENPDARASEKMGIKAGDYLVVMEYAPGATLSAFRSAMPDEKMTLFQALEYARPVASALDYAHEKKVLHRDIKPQNIMVSREGGLEVKVLDFGLAAEIRSSMSRKSINQQESNSGSPNYMAPEQWLGKWQNERTDQYAFATTIYELLSGEVPFKSAFDTGNHHIMRDVVFSESAEPLDVLSKRQNAVLLRALNKKSEKRFASCIEFIDALRDVDTKPKKKSGAGWVFFCLLIGGLLFYQTYFGGGSVSDTWVAVGVELKETCVVLKTPKQPSAGKKWTAKLGAKVDKVFLPIPAGDFLMGSNEGADDEKPVRKVRINTPFWMAKTEVTQGEFKKFISETGYKTQSEKQGWAWVYEGAWKKGKGKNWRNIFVGKNRPVTCVSWDDAMEFCEWLTKKEHAAERMPREFKYTLPTEAQWEYACRAGTKEKYAGELDLLAWYSENSGSETHPVGTKKANAWGLHDMHGNVWEWCLDDWARSYEGASLDGTRRGNGTGFFRVYRGGGWSHNASSCRSAKRGLNSPIHTYNYLGFRPVVVTQTGSKMFPPL